ncbi:50S ribosomal protein L27 [Candidatus Berkelbacteria bacterium]|uniref:Large ribosomal subunit protein bL27 n=1 Tax=Candidatus Berkelbacteria bacterium CG10_big_fil_rev_8_21_14_0_10_43_14 TaxID=1974515 RepID=A0A2M6R9E5_9BACT|nr:50S ribosomal protein L27 [Candidatus Berkelbacteria bacterium]OIP06454.1 MAG: 50S ribosomal protein L27 [Candidatus Berkelbacteria bacterium CG2_30_43_20]PIS07143.1 MAG: 50S ribosomal protein L27 [Candidatus Berkelbacteria bacterium CG10_big_fil_rev_8_21_14_0_10_43_14]PIU86973.1 MAG: 50S ribosomal protein L27 [Candidatus Berkelbacteria bacterium CG06_land_8_20_14_3_00_43_10]
MAHTKAKGSTKLGRDSQSKRLGIKRFGGELVSVGQVLIRQRGSKWYAGKGVARGGDDTVFAMQSGAVSFTRKAVRNYNGKKTQKTFIHVISADNK